MWRWFVVGFPALFMFNVVVAKTSDDNCAEGFSGSVIAILVDVSDPLSVPNGMSYQALVNKIIEQAPKHSRVDVYKIAAGSTGVAPPEISLCKPGPKSDNSFMSGEKYWANRITTRFHKPLKMELESLGQTPVPGKSSPILESIFTISIRSFSADEKMSGQKGKLIVVSDFMQHSDIVSFFNTNIPDYSTWRKTEIGRSWVRNFGNVEVFAVVIPRSGSSALPKRGRNFFVEYFQENFRKMEWIDLSQSSALRFF